MKSADLNKFLRLAEEREPVFREVLVAANDMVKEGFQDHVSNTKTAMIRPPRLLPSPPSGLNMSERSLTSRSGWTLKTTAKSLFEIVLPRQLSLSLNS